MGTELRTHGKWVEESWRNIGTVLEKHWNWVWEILELSWGNMGTEFGKHRNWVGETL